MTGTPTPIPGLPTDQTLTAVNSHTAPGDWAFIATDSGSPIGVKINALWQGQPGDLSTRTYSAPPGQAPMDTAEAVPFYLSWSYVVLGGSTDEEPAPILLPGPTGSLYAAESPFDDRDCPDYSPITSQGIGFLITHCSISMTQDGAYPIGIAFAVPDQTQQYWFLDAPTARAIDTGSGDIAVIPTATPTDTGDETGTGSPTPTHS